MMQTSGDDLVGEEGEDSTFGAALIDFAQSMRDLADVKDELVCVCVCVVCVVCGGVWWCVVCVVCVYGVMCVWCDVCGV